MNCVVCVKDAVCAIWLAIVYSCVTVAVTDIVCVNANTYTKACVGAYNKISSRV